MSLEHSFQGVARVLEEVPPVRDLHRIRRTLRGSLRVGFGSVAGDDLDAGVLLEPLGERGGLTPREKGYGSMALLVDEDGAVGVSSPDGPVVDAEYPRGRRLGERCSTSQA